MPEKKKAALSTTNGVISPLGETGEGELVAAEVASLFVSTADEEQQHGSRALPEGPWVPPPDYQSSPLTPALNITFTRFSKSV